jgi:signal peptidase I
MLRRADVITAGLIAAAAAIGLARAAFTVIRVDGDSMIPSYRSGDAILIVRRWVTGPVCPGDVIVCRLPPGVPGPDGYLVKRVTGVAAGQLTLRGDGPVSYDSRAFGPVAENHVLGRVVARLTPRGQPGGRAV